MAKINVTQGTAGAYGAGELQLQNKAPMDGTLRIVTDSANTASPLNLSTALVQSTSTVKITTSDVAYIDAEDNTGNNRFTVSRAVASQLVTVDFASLPTALTTPVGAIRTGTDGVNLANVMTFLENGNIGINTDTAGAKLDVHSASNVIAQFNRTGAGKSWIQYLLAGAAKWNTGFDNVNGNFTIYDAVNSLDRLVVTNGGDVGIGTTVSSWDATFTAVQIGTGTNIYDNGNANGSFVGSNYFYNGTNNIYKNTGFATAYGQINGDHAFFNAPSGTAGNITTFTERMRITAAGDVGIGTATPSYLLDIASTSPTLRIRNITPPATGGTSSLLFEGINNFSGVSQSFINNVQAGNSGSTQLTFGTSGPTDSTAVEKMRITNDGYLRLSTNSLGIQFNGDTAAANALDDYEEGTWTMGISFGNASVGVTTDSNTGTYTKIGRQVTVNGLIQLTSKGSSTGSAKITGLPFTIANNTGNYSAPSLRLTNITFTNQFQGYGDINTTTIPLEEVTILGAVTDLTNTDFANNSAIIVSMTYFV